MTFDQLLLGLMAAGIGSLGWFGRVLYDAVNKLKDDLTKLEIKIGTDYVRYDRLQDALNPVIERLEHIYRELTHKVDRVDHPRRGHE